MPARVNGEDTWRAESFIGLWGSTEVFNSNYPDPKGMVEDLHRNSFHVMISVWPFFERGSAVYDEMDKRGWFIDRTKVAGFHPEGMAVYDGSNPEARAYYWQLMNKALFQIGFDAWWLDTVEPETEGCEENIQLGHKLAIGNSDFESLKRQIPAGLNFSLSGVPYWTTDIGGFTSGNSHIPDCSCGRKPRHRHRSSV